MHINDPILEQRAQLALPAAALVIDIRGMYDDDPNDLTERLSIGIDDLASESKTQGVPHWRFLPDFLSFKRIEPDKENDRQHEHSSGAGVALKLHGLTGQVHSARPHTDHASNGAATEFNPYQQQVKELIQEIDRVRTNRIAAVNDLNNAAIPGHSAQDPTVRVIFVTDIESLASLNSAARYAESLKTYYRNLERPGYQSLLNTTVLCLSNRGEVGLPTLLIENLTRNNCWDHLDSLILSEVYREDAALIGEPAAQAYIAELLLYVLLIIPPLGVSVPATSQDDAPPNGTAAEEQPLGLPVHTYIVGLAALEYSARWGRRWLNFGLAKDVIDVLCKTSDQSNQEKRLMAESANSWFQDWRDRVREIIPAHTPAHIAALEGLSHARQVSDATGQVFTAGHFNLDIGESSVNDLAAYLARLAQTYITSSGDPTLQDALMHSTPQIMQALPRKEGKSQAERAVTDLGKLQVETEQILKHPKFFVGPVGAVPRARVQLEAIGSTIGNFQRDHEDDSLHPLSLKGNLQHRQQDLVELGRKKIDDLKKHLQRWPLLCSNRPLKLALALIMLLLILVISGTCVFAGFAWLHHLLALKAPNLLPFADAPFLGVPTLVIVAVAVTLLVLALECALLGPALTNKNNNGRAVELGLLATLVACALFGFFVSFSLASLSLLPNDPLSIHYLAWLAFVQGLSFLSGLCAVIIVAIEIFYFAWWYTYLLQERRRIVNDLRRQQQQDIEDVARYIADDVALALARRAELTNERGELGDSYYRVTRLGDLLDKMAQDALYHQELAANRLLFSQSETQQGIDGGPKGDVWLNLRIREEKLQVEELTDTYKSLRQELLEDNEELTVLAECLLRSQGVEMLAALEEEFAGRPQKGASAQRRLQLFVTALVASATRFAVEPFTSRNVVPLNEQYHRVQEYARQDVPILNSLAQTLNRRISQASLQSIMQRQSTGSQVGLNIADRKIATTALATWGQLFWQQRHTSLEQVLQEDGVLSHLLRLLHEHYDPRAILRRLRARAVPLGRSLNIGQPGDLYLLLAPSPQSQNFSRGLKSLAPLNIMPFPDVERILLLEVRPFTAEPLPLLAPVTQKPAATLTLPASADMPSLSAPQTDIDGALPKLASTAMPGP